MSYILDALRKSEQQRQLGAAPGLLTVHLTPEATQPAFLMYGLIAATLMAAGVAIGWWRPWQQTQGFSAAEIVTAETRESRPRPLPEPLPVLPEITPKPKREKPVQKSPTAVNPVPSPGLAHARQGTDLRAKAAAETRKLLPQTVAAIPEKTATPGREVANMPAVEKAVTSSQDKPANAAPADAAQQQKVISMAELPPVIQQELPAMSIPLHTYSSTPKERIVGINDRLLQEGDYVAPGVKLEEIAPDSVIFSYKKYLFRRSVR